MNSEETLISLADMGVGERARVQYVGADDGMRKRYYDIGLLPGTRIDCLMQKGKRGMRAYRIRGAVIAIRLDDVKDITVSAEGCS